MVTLYIEDIQGTSIAPMFREDVNCEIVFLNKNDPDLEFEGLLKREKTRVTYCQVREHVKKNFAAGGGV